MPELGVGAQALGPDWLASLNRFIDYVYWEAGKAAALFDSKQVFLTPRLASLYGQSAPASDALAAATLPDRSGLLTQPALMALLAHGDQSAPVLRGAFVRERIMCLPVPPPPPSVNTTPPDRRPEPTTRERFAQHTGERQCAGCHELHRRRRASDSSATTSSAAIRATEKASRRTSGRDGRKRRPELDGPFDRRARRSAARLGAEPRVRDCLATNWYRYAMGRMETEAEACSLDDVKSASSTSGGEFAELLVAITQS